VLGLVQYLTGVPEVLVTLHVAGAAAVTAATAALWAHTRQSAPASNARTPVTNEANAAAR